MKIQFGTDGWRALIAKDFTFDNVALCAQGVASYLREEGVADKGLIVGYDTRFASEDFAARVAEVLAGNGITTYLSIKAAPTPAVSYNILKHGAAGAAIITASHNPAQWNGFKYKPHYAGSATPEVTEKLELAIADAAVTGVNSIALARARSDGLVQDIDPEPPYMNQIARLVDLESIAKAGLNVVVDAMFGAGSGYLSSLLAQEGSGTSVLEIHGERNPSFPGMERPEPIEPNLQALSGLVMEKRADVGIAFDGDADRVGIIDEKGRFLTTLQTFALLALYLLEVKGERGALVKSLTSTSMIYRLGELFGVPVFETQVGFKFICPIMLGEDALIGGEESGGYGFRGHIPERDGILSGLIMLEYMVRTGKRPSELIDHLFDKVGGHFYRRRDLDFPPEERECLINRLESGGLSEVAGMPVVSTDSVDGRRFFFPSGAWLLARFSGTEPVLRIYSEAGSLEEVERLLDGAEEFLGI